METEEELDDFGFSFQDDVSEDFANETKMASERTEKLFRAIDKFLENLAKDPEKEIIKWPNRAKEIKAFRLKLRKIASETS